MKSTPRVLILMSLAVITALIVSTQLIAQTTTPATTPAASDAAPPATDISTTASDQVTTAADSGLPTLVELFYFSPTINSILLGLSGLALMLFLFFMLTINHQAMVPGSLVEEVTKLVVRNQPQQAADLCRAHRRVFVASIFQRVCENADQDPALVIDILDTEGRRRADLTWNRISYLADIANTAPMVGLLGTVLGMIKAFFSLDVDQANLTNTSLAQGVGEAMATTLFGLVVAIAATVFYSMVKSKTTRVLADIDQASHTVADLMFRQRGIALDEITRESAATQTPPANLPANPPTNPTTNPPSKPKAYRRPVSPAPTASSHTADHLENESQTDRSGSIPGSAPGSPPNSTSTKPGGSGLIPGAGGDS